MTNAPLQLLRCGNCGADVPITSPATIVVTCEHCGTMSRRSDVDLTTIGKVALPTPLASHFQVGTEGRFRGRAFVVRGQIQLDHGAGLWNEWAAEADEGWLWIAEAQGELHVYEELEVDAQALPTRELLPDTDERTGDFDPATAKGKRWSAGDGVDVARGNDQGGMWTIREIGRGKIVACRGEFPVRVSVGARTTYVDLMRGTADVATLDFTRPGPPEFLVGRQVDLADLEVDPSTMPDHRPERVAAVDITCPKCGGTIDVSDPEHALTLGCVHCSAKLQRENHLQDYEAVDAKQRIRSAPRLPLGARTTLRGDEVTVLGFLLRGVRDRGEFYTWSEYLLRAADGRYRWLVESDGHWTYVTPIQASAILRRGSKCRLGGREFKHFTRGDAVVDSVLGECYWQVASGETVRSNDYVHPASSTMLSIEETPLELTASLGEYLPRSEVAAAFPDAKLPGLDGVGAAQPNPTNPIAMWRTFLVLLLLLTGSCVAVRVHHANEVVLRQQFGPTPATSSEETVQFSEPFDVVRGAANLKVFIKAPSLDQGYLDVLGALVHEETGEVTTFTIAAQRYHGVSGGESWSEGDGDSYALIGRVTAGPYRLRLASRGYDAGVNTSYDVTVRSQVPRVLWFILALVLLLFAPVIASIRALAFESKRWSKSDHPWSSE